MMFVPTPGTVMFADTPKVLAAVMSGRIPVPFQPLTTLACKVRASLILYVARTPVCSKGILKNRIERE